MFNIALEKFIRPDEEVKLQDSSIGLLVYADDLVLMEESRYLSRELKIQLYTTLLRPVITYGAETLPLRKEDERKLMI